MPTTSLFCLNRHLGSEHYSYGEYDEDGNGPHGNIERPEWANDRTLFEAAEAATDEKVQDGFRCHHYDDSDAKFTTPYNWQHCKGMEV
jgi:hypothetical protein